MESGAKAKENMVRMVGRPLAAPPCLVWFSASFQAFLEESSLFKLGKLKQAVALPTAEIGGRSSSDLQSVVQGEYEKIVLKWQEEPTTPRLHFPNRLHNPLAEPAELRRVCKRFKVGTALSLEGVHPRVPTILSDEALATLALLIQAMEANSRSAHAALVLGVPFHS